jgi:hypothetical protein
MRASRRAEHDGTLCNLRAGAASVAGKDLLADWSQMHLIALPAENVALRLADLGS